MTDSLENLGSDALTPFELAQLHFERADFGKALPLFNRVSAQSLSERDFETFMRSQAYVMRIWVQQEKYIQVQELKEQLQDLVLSEGIQMSSPLFYILSVSAVYRKQYELAWDYAIKAQELAKNDIDWCYGVSAQVGIMVVRENWPEVTRINQILEQRLAGTNLVDLRVHAQMIKVRILAEAGQPEKGLLLCWACFDLIREFKTIAAQINILYTIGCCYRDLGQLDLARSYLKIAYESTDPLSLTRLARRIKEDLESLGTRAADLVLNSKDHQVIEKNLGTVDFKNQFVLLDLLKLLATHQGEVFSKKTLVEQVWHESYNPELHDNKIYVTIKRLRQLIEPDLERPKYIFRSKNGYFINHEPVIRVDGEL